MKFIVTGILLILTAAPVLANYDQMNQALENYEAPLFLNHASKERSSGPSDDANLPTHGALSQVFEDIRAMQTAQENDLSRSIPFKFLGVIDKSLINEMQILAKDDKALGARIENRLVLGEVEILTALRNPAILAARKQVLAALASYDQITGLDQTILKYQGLTRGVDTKVGPVPMKGSIRQSWPLPGSTALKGKIVQADVAMAQDRLAMVEKKMVTLAVRAYWDLVGVDDALGVTRETIKALERLQEVATSLYKSGRIGFQNIIKINIRLALVKEDLVTLAFRRKTVSVRIAEMMNLPQEIFVGLAVPIDMDRTILEPQVLYPLALAHRQELSFIRHKIDKLSHMVELAESMTNSPFSLGLSFNENDLVNTVGTRSSKNAFAEKTMAGMKNNQPANAWNSIAQPWLVQTRKTLEGLEFSLAAQEKAAMTMVKNAWFTMDKNRREFILYKKEILPLSKSALDVATREYETGAIPFSQAIEAYTDWLKLGLAMADRRSNLGSSLAVLEQVIGKQF